MNESPNPGHSPDFLARVQLLLTPTYAECFTNETRKVQNLLLVTSFVLVLFAFGAVAVDAPASFQVPLLGFPITVITGMRWLLIVLCLYFLASFSTRAYAEWKLWRLHHQAPMLELLELVTEIESSWLRLTTDANRTLKSINEVAQGNLKELTNDLKSTAAPCEEKREELSREYKALCKEIESRRDLLKNADSWKDISRLGNERDRIFKALAQVDHKLRHDRAERREGTQNRSEAQKRRLAELEDLYRSQTEASELKVLEAQLDYLQDAVRPLKKILEIRRWLEALFPIGLGTVAIVLGIIVHKTG